MKTRPALRHSCDTTGETGNPSSANRIAAANSESNGTRPNLSCSTPQASGAPGTETLVQPRSGNTVCPAARNASAESARGAGPDAFSPCSFSPSHTIAKASLPMPFEVGSTTVRVIAVASAASTALPPARSAARPACAASGWLAATMPPVESTTLRREGQG